jgi:hypothetical protein
MTLYQRLMLESNKTAIKAVADVLSRVNFNDNVMFMFGWIKITSLAQRDICCLFLIWTITVVCNFLTGGVGGGPIPAYPNPAIPLTTIHTHK